MTSAELTTLVGDKADNLPNHVSQTMPLALLYLPSADFLNRIFITTDLSPQVLRSLGQLFNHG